MSFSIYTTIMKIGERVEDEAVDVRVEIVLAMGDFLEQEVGPREGAGDAGMDHQVEPGVGLVELREERVDGRIAHPDRLRMADQLDPL
ncbi:hypothetical protein PTTG_01663 [Puccinia triticina 1-1 BBBD Race 1]|uniref:Uncharacterized protein n=1 Tax=Puccinia triticina (isolate 1-1 / race 1 (BBBD)) TaxID=630390 RepID=A0A0C4ELM9_PUCT1|nr:hypothetical protein PTTG_01663 [Puccinia triticina 1-1 BBBD Race 1]